MEKVLQKSEATYLNYNLIAKHIEDKQGKGFVWSIYKDGKHLLSDNRSIDGSTLQGLPHSINDAKKNIDTLIRLKEWQ